MNANNGQVVVVGKQVGALLAWGLESKCVACTGQREGVGHIPFPAGRGNNYSFGHTCRFSHFLGQLRQNSIRYD